MIILIENLANSIIFLFLFIGNFLIGVFIYTKLVKKEERTNSLEQFIFGTGIGYGIICYLMLLFGFLGLLYRLIAYIILLFIFALGVYLNRKECINFLANFKENISKIKDFSFFERIFLVYILSFIFLSLIASLAPPTGQDVLSTYLAIPKIFLKKHFIFNLKENFLSNYPLLPSYVYLYALLLSSGVIAQLIHWSFNVMSIFVLYALARKFSRTVGLLSSSIYITLQPVIWESSLAFTDLAQVFYLLLAFYALLKFVNLKKNIWIFFAGSICGLAAGCKGLGPIYAGTLTIIIIINFLSKKNIKEIFKILFIFIGSFLCIASVWYIKSFVFTGNPFFPAFFGGRGVNQEWLQDFEKSLSLNSPIEDIESFIRFPFDLTVYPEKYGGWVSPLIFLFIPFLIFYRERKEKILLNIFGFCIILFLIISLLKITFSIRYFLIIFVLLSIPASVAACKIINQKRQKLLKISAISVILVWLGFAFVYTFWNKSSTFSVVIGSESKGHYIQRKHPDDVNFLKAFNFIDKNLSTDAKILYFGSRGYYLNRDYIRFWRLYTGLIDTKKIINSYDLLKTLKELGITHILIDYKIINYYIKDFINSQESTRLFELIKELINNQYFLMIFQVDSCFLYSFL